MKKPKSLRTAKLKFIIALVLLVAGFVYTISPIDLIPDLLGPIGWVDDLAALIVTFIFAAISFYRMKRAQSREIAAKSASDPSRNK